MHRALAAVAVIGLVAALLALSQPRLAPSHAAAQPGSPAATPELTADEAEIADLRNRVAALSTRVAALGGADVEAVAGRLGGSRAGFDDIYGRPIAFLAPGEVSYDVPAVGRVTVTFTDDQATSIVLSPPRPSDLPLDQRDAADWPEETALAEASRYFPVDAAVAPAVETDTALTVTGTSEALTAAMTPADELGCPVSGATPFTATFTRAGPGTISAAVIETAPPGDASLLPREPVPPEEGQLSQGGSRAIANSSLGGTVSINGIQAVATSARPDAQGPRPSPAGYQLYTVDLHLENQSAQPLTYELSDFILVDRRGNEATAICGGVEPAITRGDLAPGDALEGVVTFEVPERFRADRLVVLLYGARVGFQLR
jgi:hypothetical protein